MKSFNMEAKDIIKDGVYNIGYGGYNWIIQIANIGRGDEVYGRRYGRLDGTDKLINMASGKWGEFNDVKTIREATYEEKVLLGIESPLYEIF